MQSAQLGLGFVNMPQLRQSGGAFSCGIAGKQIGGVCRIHRANALRPIGWVLTELPLGQRAVETHGLRRCELERRDGDAGLAGGQMRPARPEGGGGDFRLAEIARACRSVEMLRGFLEAAQAKRCETGDEACVAVHRLTDFGRRKAQSVLSLTLIKCFLGGIDPRFALRRARSQRHGLRR